MNRHQCVQEWDWRDQAMLRNYLNNVAKRAAGDSTPLPPDPPSYLDGWHCPVKSQKSDSNGH